jgi:hypothetical protein
MGTVLRPVFSNGERLTAQRLNELVEYLRTSLRRVLLAPLSPGVAAGFELQGDTQSGTTPQTAFSHVAMRSTLLGLASRLPGVAAVTVTPGVAIDGIARILVSSQDLTFTYSDIVAQIPDLASGDVILVSVGADGGGASCRPTECIPCVGQSVTEGIKLYFSRIPLDAETFVTALATPAPSVDPWADPIDQGGADGSYAVPLGLVAYNSDGNTLSYSMLRRAGVMPDVGALRNSFGDISLVLNRVASFPFMAVTVPTIFETTAPAFFMTLAGGPLVQASTVAADLGMPAAGRPCSALPNVLEAAGGYPATAGLSGIGVGSSGVTGVSMQYDTGAGSQPYSAYGGFPTVPHAGFPLVLSQGATALPLVAPPPPPGTNANANIVGLSASPSYADPTDPSGSRQLVPVATAGIIFAYVNALQAMSVGTLLSPNPVPTGNPGQWPLIAATGSTPVVAQLATPISAASQSAGGTPAWVWVMPPPPAPPTQVNP